MNTVAEKINSSIDSLSPTERRIARALLADYPSAGLGTTSSLASAANSSAASVIRFCAHLGFDSFGQMQDRLRDELTTRSASPLDRAEAETSRIVSIQADSPPAVMTVPVLSRGRFSRFRPRKSSA
jgi:DNA-binding MurR/RpiR family transcriptional regulator